MVLTGKGYDSMLYDLNGASNFGFYDTARHQTYLNVTGDTDTLHLQLALNISGDTAFTFQHPFIYPDSAYIIIKNTKNQKYSTYGLVPYRSVINIVRYDTPSGKILAAFSGPFINLIKNTDTIYVTRGRISVIRFADEY